MTTAAVGSETWWQSKTGPQWQREGDTCQVTFWWRDPQGTELTSATCRVWIYITGVTDHHHDAAPQSMTRIVGTDVWYWQTVLPAQWRGSYCFIPSRQQDDFDAQVFDETTRDKQAVREGWRKLLPNAIADPLNHLSWRGGRGHPFCALALEDAPHQPGWNAAQTAYRDPHCLLWQSTMLANTRRVWIYTTGESAAPDRPLAILLDGQFWAESMPIWSPLATLTAEGQLPAAVYLLIDVIDDKHRSRELPCYQDFWLAIQQELLPIVMSIAPFSAKADRTLVAGQSFGGLSALYAGLNWPERFGCVLSQSGSYWWPDRQGKHEGILIEQLKNHQISASGLRIILQAGRREPLILRVNQTLYPLLASAKERWLYEIEGGHDAFCWRGGLTAGLIALWQPLAE